MPVLIFASLSLELFSVRPLLCVLEGEGSDPCSLHFLGSSVSQRQVAFEPKEGLVGDRRAGARESHRMCGSFSSLGLGSISGRDYCSTQEPPVSGDTVFPR